MWNVSQSGFRATASVNARRAISISGNVGTSPEGYWIERGFCADSEERLGLGVVQLWYAEDWYSVRPTYSIALR